jgi:A118 family predicted phage portal protein
MITAIESWDAILSGNAPWITESVKSLGIEIGIVEDIAHTCTAEMDSEVTIPELDIAYKTAIRDLTEELQDGLGLGSFIIKPLGIYGGVEYVTAKRFIPIKIDNYGKLVDVIFIDVRKAGTNKWNIRLERHTLRNKVLTITNKAYQTSNFTSMNHRVPLDVEEDWATLPEEISYSGVERPIFGYFKVPKKNRIDGGSLGVSLLVNAIGLIKDADEQYGRLLWEFIGGEMAVHVAPEALPPGTKGKDKHSPSSYRLPEHQRRLYRRMDIDKAQGFFDVFAPDLRDQSIINGLNEMLRRIEFATDLAYGDLSNVSEVAKTATEIRASKQRKYQLINAIEENLKDCLDDLVYGLAFFMGKTMSGYEFNCTFRDSILTDDAEEARSMREDVAAGILRPEKYLEKRYGVTEETIPEWLAGAEAVQASLTE